MAFNREAKKRRGFLGKIRSLPGCERVRPSDLDGLDEKDMREIRNDVDRIKQDISSINRVQVLASSTPIIQNIKKAKSSNPVFVLDEVDDFEPLGMPAGETLEGIAVGGKLEH